jgi:carbonic anhydrase
MHTIDNRRRRFLKGAGIALLAGGTTPGLSLLSRPARADAGRPAAMTRDAQAAITPDAALQMLRDGNARFVAGDMRQRDYRQQVQSTAKGQFPFAAIVGCMDSRASNELIFDQGIGDLFSQRVAGNYVDDGILGGLEFACAVSGAKLIAVVGHNECGAIRGACDHVDLGNLTRTLDNLKPAVDAVPGYPAGRTSRNAAFVQAVATQNVFLGLERIRARSPILQNLIDKGAIALVGAMYDIHTGRATFLQA